MSRVAEPKLTYWYVRSVDAEEGSSTSFAVRMATGGKAMRCCRVTSVTIPYLYYPVDAHNNQVTTNLGTATVPPGYYTGVALATAIQTELQVIDATFTVVYNAAQFSYTIARGAGNFSLLWDLNAITEATGEYLGFGTAIQVGAATYTGGATDLVGIQGMYLRSDTLSKGAPACVETGGRTDSNVIMRIPLGVPGNTIVWSPAAKDLAPRFYHSDQKLSRVDFRLTSTDDDLPINLQGAEIEIELEVYLD